VIRHDLFISTVTNGVGEETPDYLQDADIILLGEAVVPYLGRHHEIGEQVLARYGVVSNRGQCILEQARGSTKRAVGWGA
jgi:hypothetical protein